MDLTNFMTKLGYGLSVLGVVAILFLFLSAPREGRFGIEMQTVDYTTSAVTATRIACLATSTTVVAAQGGRSSFEAYNLATSTIFLCKSAGACSATSSIPLAPSSTVTGLPSFYRQSDGYKGEYRCSAPGGGALNVIYSQ